MDDQRLRRRNGAFVLVAILAAGLVGLLAYNAGVAHGVAMSAVAGAAGAAVEEGGRTAAAYHHPYGYYGWHPWGFGFGFPLFPLFALFFFVFACRVLFWGGPGRRHWHHHRDGCDLPPRFDDWHRRAHERMKDEPPASHV
jgi:hypothetical protein